MCIPVKIGIDFGTTNTIVSYFVNNQAEVVRLSDQLCTPTVLYFESENSFIIGQSALKKGIEYPIGCVRNFKTDFDDPDKFYDIVAENGEEFRITPREAAAKFMQKLAADAQIQIARQNPDYAQAYIDELIVTVPVKFNPVAKGVVREAAYSVVDEDHCKLMTEPVAAGFCYIQTHQDMVGKTLLVYDFGGGTFDISLLKVTNDEVCTLIDQDNNPHLGGNDLTRSIVAYLFRFINDDMGQNMPERLEDYIEGCCSLSRKDYLKNYATLWEQAEKIKADLSMGLRRLHALCPIIIMDNGKRSICELDRILIPDAVTTLFQSLITETLNLTRDFIQRTRHSIGGPIDYIVLAGGSSQIPAVRTGLSELARDLGEQEGWPTRLVIDPESATLISRGATLVHNQGVNPTKLHTDIGISAKKGVVFNAFVPILTKNTPPDVEGSVRVSIPNYRRGDAPILIYERDPDRTYEDESVDPLQVIDKITIRDLPETPNREAEIFLSIDNEGVLKMRVDILANGHLVSKNHKSYRRSNLVDEREID